MRFFYHLGTMQPPKSKKNPSRYSNKALQEKHSKTNDFLTSDKMPFYYLSGKSYNSVRHFLGVPVSSGIVDMSQHREFLGRCIGMTDDSSMMRIHSNPELFVIFF